ncbi:MAG: flagellar type III secretion system protein FliR [Candidatus Latescibacteria bacterium]|nr:flagellar type III secretion system protein FliR [Candidatus Latescibacterota bacterium]
MSILDYTLEQFELFLLVLARTGAILVTVPVLGHRNIPSHVKIGLAMVTALVVFPIASIKPAADIPPHLVAYILVVAKELIMGLVLSFVVLLIFVGVQFGGQMVGIEMGYGIVNVLDPQTASQVSIIGEFQYLLALLIFILTNGHHIMLSGLVSSFDLVPLGGVTFSSGLSSRLLDMATGIFVVAVKISAPAMVTMFLTSTVLGIAARTVPQMNILLVGFPLKIAIGALMLAWSMPFFYFVLTKLIANLNNDVLEILRYFGG